MIHLKSHSQFADPSIANNPIIDFQHLFPHLIFQVRALLICITNFQQPIDLQQFLGRFDVEDMIDELVVGDGTDEGRFILTSNHEGESLQAAIEFAESLSSEYAGKAEVVEL